MSLRAQIMLRRRPPGRPPRTVAPAWSAEKIEEKTSMLFEFTRRDGAPTVFNDGTTFHVDQINRFGDGGSTDVSHLIDKSYGYHSSRELRWHLAERFGLTPSAVAVREAH